MTLLERIPCVLLSTDPLVSEMRSLASKGEVEFTMHQETTYVLTEEGERIRIHGWPEDQIHLHTKPEIIRLKLGAVLSSAVKMGVVTVTGDIVTQVKPCISLNRPDFSPEETATLLKRKVIRQVRVTKYSVRAGVECKETLATDLTSEMIRNGIEGVRFKQYNFRSKGRKVQAGGLNRLLELRQEFRQILLRMGFQEMETNQWVESSYWNFDAVFTPQNHPARDSHDTFFTGLTAELPAQAEQVAAAHRNTYRSPWLESEAKKCVLRTHTTASTAKMLHALAKDFKPTKCFSIDRVFRNETVDSTHLAEFHQVEGVVADYGLSLGDLMGTVQQFFNEVGITDFRFKPAYNPYTEPSMEIFGYSDRLERWMEIGNSGMFRPEMLRALGLPDGVNVIAFGLSLERPAMIRFNCEIRDLYTV